jgi:hypothetical protein
MKEIYVRTLDGWNDTILSENEPYLAAYPGVYLLIDIRGTEYRFPTGMTLFRIKDWVFDGNFENIDGKYRNVIKELKGYSTGISTASKK